jgi:hypothetical protein
MRKLAFLLGMGLLLALGVMGTGTATAGPQDTYTCTSGSIPGGLYKGLIVTGPCTFGGDVAVNGDLIVEAGAILNDHAASGKDVRVTGDVFVGEGAVLGLGAYGPPGISTATRVNGDIIADRPLSLYLSGITVNGNVTSTGSVTPAEFRNFPFKDNKVNGNLTIVGWDGGWLGVIRAQVNGTVTVSNNSSVILEGGEPGVDSDSTEVQTNVIHGDLICFGNTPAAQVNAADGGQLNRVNGQKIGECADL